MSARKIKKKRSDSFISPMKKRRAKISPEKYFLKKIDSKENAFHAFWRDFRTTHPSPRPPRRRLHSRRKAARQHAADHQRLAAWGRRPWPMHAGRCDGTAEAPEHPPIRHERRNKTMSTCTRCKHGCMIPQDCPEDRAPSALPTPEPHGQSARCAVAECSAPTGVEYHLRANADPRDERADLFEPQEAVFHFPCGGCVHVMGDKTHCTKCRHYIV
jgi:hypothetical protein